MGNDSTSSFEKFKNIFIGFISIVTGLGGIFGLLYGVHNYIEKVVGSKIRSPEVIEKLSLKIRPFLIFNTDNVILYNKGAYDEFIEDINFEDFYQGYPKRVIVETQSHIQVAPMLECLTYNCYAEPKRGSGNRWEYKLISKSYLELQESEHIKDHIFRLEIIR